MIESPRFKEAARALQWATTKGDLHEQLSLFMVDDSFTRCYKKEVVTKKKASYTYTKIFFIFCKLFFYQKAYTLLSDFITNALNFDLNKLYTCQSPMNDSTHQDYEISY